MGYNQGDATDDLFNSFMAAPPKNETLERINQLIDWKPLRKLMAKCYAEGAGREGFDPVLLFKLMLLEQYYKLSDREVVFMASDSLSFRSFLGLGARGIVPDDTTLVKFRNRLRKAQLLDELFELITAQMTAHGLAVRDGSLRLVDATIVSAAPVMPTKDTPADEIIDPDASFTRKNGKYYYGYKLHVGQDRETGLIVGHKVTTASVHDSNVFEELLGPGAGEAMADKAYDNIRSRNFCQEEKITCSIMHQARGREVLSEEKISNNKRISRARGLVEGAHATLKRFLRCGRAVYNGLARVKLQMQFGVLAFNLRRYSALDRGRCA